MRRLLGALQRWFWRLACGQLVLLAGCPQEIDDYAVEYGPPPPDTDPRVEIVDFTYTPGPPVHPGQTIQFTVTLNRPVSAGYREDAWVELALDRDPETGGPGRLHHVATRNDGVAPDQRAGDKILVAEFTIPADCPPAEGLPVFATYSVKQVYAPELSIAENTEETTGGSDA